MTEFVDMLLELTRGRTFPAGTDTWAIRTKRAGHAFSWPSEGWVEAPGPILEHESVAPAARGDGLCVAFTWAGMATAPLVPDELLLVAYADADRLSVRDDQTARVRRAYVLEEIDGLRLLRERSLGANLMGARLELADLRGACFYGADLSRSILDRANLAGASLYGANLAGARMPGADLSGADLRRTNLTSANLMGVKVSEETRFGAADLSWVNAAKTNLFAADWS